MSGLIQLLRQQIEETLAVEFGNCEIVEPLRSAVGYSIFPAGKRIRPLFALALCRDCGGREEGLLRSSVALELIHCASLVHDDLPALDNDDERRGKPSCHKAHGEAAAILAGDAMVSWATSIIACDDGGAARQLRLVEILNNAYLELCGGQQLDLLQGAARPSLCAINKLKTGALFSAAFMFGAIGAGKEEEVVARCGTLGMAIGEYFQHVDDVHDGTKDRKDDELRSSREAVGREMTSVARMCGCSELPLVREIIAEIDATL